MPGRVLYIDAYDSFTNNIISLLHSHLAVSVSATKIDDPRFVLNDEAFHAHVAAFDAVVAGPGPGHPANEHDVGLIGKLWRLPERCVRPVLGICLGCQSLALAFGARVERLDVPRHGLVTMISHCGQGLYAGTGEVRATQYHSLRLRLGDGEAGLWKPSESCAELLPLAWDLSDERNGPVLMAVRHCRLPFVGVQYHPESICTSEEGRRVVERWWGEVEGWRGRIDGPSKSLRSNYSTECTAVDARDAQTAERGCGKPSARYDAVLPSQVRWTTVQLASSIQVTELVELLGGDGQESILLESGLKNGSPVNPETGRYSIIALHDRSSKHIRYHSSTQRLEVLVDGKALKSDQGSVDGAFDFMETFMAAHKAAAGAPDSPFWGGLVGFVSYEAGLETINVPPAASEHPDVWFVFCDRSVVLDHITGTAYVQSIRAADDAWLQSLTETLTTLTGGRFEHRKPSQHHRGSFEVVSVPEKASYCDKISICHSHLLAGSSYELCLTDQTLIRSILHPWTLYLRLRALNPAPFAAFMQLKQHDATLDFAGSSPERFLSWSRDGHCQFRPIKGTVKKTPGMTRARAEELLGSEKERAENLMIVDLIRHDLAGVEGIRDIQVPKLMTVEEYSTLFQLVSVISGQVPGGAYGLAVLRSSLPPGSMTGAPKKRSCELLKAVEGPDSARGLYSGVLGYVDVGGGGDFSVVIRSAFRWNDGCWRVGAGGAVTVLSEERAEWEEMGVKRESVMQVFR